MTTFELPKIVLNSLKKSEYGISYLMIWLFLSSIMFWKQTMMATILTGDDIEIDNTRNRIVVLILVLPFLRHGIFGNYISYIIADIKAIIVESYLLRYDSLTLQSKESFKVRILVRKLHEVEWGISYWIESGLPTFFNLFSSMYLCIYTFYITDMMNVFYSLIIFNGILYKWVKQHLDKHQAKVWEDNDKKRDKNKALLDLYLSQFTYGQKSIDSVMKLVRKNYSIKLLFDRTRNEQKLFMGILSQICIAIILLLSPTSYILSYLTVTIQFTGMMSSIFSVINANTHFESDLKSLNKKFSEGTIKKNIPYQQDLTNGYMITKYSLTKPNFTLCMRGSLNISVGNTILIQGMSGSGKTTFLKGIFGYCEDAVVSMSNYLEPRNFQSSLALMYQSIKENINVQNLTLRELFDGTENIQLIEEVLKYACVGNWVERLKNKAKPTISDYVTINIDSQKKNNDYVVINIDKEKKTSWVDIDLSEIGTLSGGEKTRLILARQLFECITKNKKVLVLDEPEQGSDPPISYKMIKNIIDNFSSRAMIIIISHLERFGGHDDMVNTSGIHFNQTVFVKDGIITVTNH